MNQYTESASESQETRPNKRRKTSVIGQLPKIIARDGGEWKCAYCGHNLLPYEDRNNDAYFDLINGEWVLKPDYRFAAADHVIPVCQGGTDDLSNLVAACERCNGQKSGKTADEFRAWQARKGGAK